MQKTPIMLVHGRPRLFVVAPEALAATVAVPPPPPPPFRRSGPGSPDIPLRDRRLAVEHAYGATESVNCCIILSNFPDDCASRTA